MLRYLQGNSAHVSHRSLQARRSNIFVLHINNTRPCHASLFHAFWLPLEKENLIILWHIFVRSVVGCFHFENYFYIDDCDCLEFRQILRSVNKYVLKHPFPFSSWVPLGVGDIGKENATLYLLYREEEHWLAQPFLASLDLSLSKGKIHKQNPK